MSENLEMFTVRLTTSTPNVILSPNEAIVRITDDDGQFVLVRVCVQDENDLFVMFC